MRGVGLSRRKLLVYSLLAFSALLLGTYFLWHCSALFSLSGGGGDAFQGGVLLTGGAGFIGYHTALALLARGDSVVVVDEVNDYYDVGIKRQHLQHLQLVGGERVAVHIASVSDEAAMARVFARHRPRAVVHLAARAGVRPSIAQPLLYVDANARGTTVLLEMVKRFGGKDTHFVLASTSSVYGEAPTVPFNEDDLAVVNAPVSPYAATKRACELMLRTYHHLYRFPATALRFFTVYGPDGRPDMAPYMFIDRIMRGEPIRQFGDGTTSRDYTYIDDIVSGVVLALDKPQGFKIYNLGRGQPVLLSKFIQVIEKAVGKDAVIIREGMKPGDVPRTFANVTKAKVELGYNPTVSIEEGIQKTVQWFQNKN